MYGAQNAVRAFLETAGEPSSRPVAAAMANAVFDATGVPIRRVPFSPDDVRSALS